MIYHIDYETFSEADISEVGAFAYAEHPSTEILLMAIARGDEEPALWVNPKYRDTLPGDPEADGLIADLQADQTALVYAHNAQFERAVTRYVDGPVKFLRERRRLWRCTAAMCRRAAIPDSLEKSGAYLKLDAQKDSRGKALIRKFSILQTSGKRVGQRILPSEEPAAFKEFGDYCLQDVRTEQKVHHALKDFELVGDVLQTFLLDMDLNDRGVPLDIPALETARRIADECLATTHEEFRALTGLNPTQREAVRLYLNEKHSLGLEDMQRDTIAEKLKEHPDIPALRLYADLQFAAVKKVHSFLAYANRDGRMRGLMHYHGASTGRWSSKGPQIQNLKKPTIALTEGVYDLLSQGCTREGLEAMYGNPLEAIASSIRHFITAPKGLLDADYAAIEARIVCWLAGQEDALERYRKGVDAYVQMASVIYGCKASEVTKAQRQLGKAAVLGAGFGMGPAKFLATCESWGIPIDAGLAERTIDAYRKTYSKVQQLWRDCDRAAISAVKSHGQVFKAGRLLSFQVRKAAGKHFLFLRLPSGREIAYPEPRIGRDPKFDADRVEYYGQQPQTTQWGFVSTYGARLVENCTQGCAADVMASGAINAANEGFVQFMLVHDQDLAEFREGQTPEAFAKALTTLPDWAAGLPVTAEAGHVRVFSK